MTGDEQALTIDGLATLLNVSVSTAYRLATTQAIPGFKVGRAWRFWEHEVRQAIATQDPWRRSNQSRARRRTASRTRNAPSAA